MTAPLDTAIPALGTPAIPSPLPLNTIAGDGIRNYVTDQTRIRQHLEYTLGQPPDPEAAFEKAGPRQHLYFNPAQTRAAIVSCGGLCPGINNVIRSAFLELYHNYGVRDILGIRHGFLGLTAQGEPPLRLQLEHVEDIHREGGSILSSSRGRQDAADMVNFLIQHNINILICIGGDGTQRGTQTIVNEITRRHLPIAVVGVPKTIDNDIQYVTTTFGYFSAIESARDILDGAHCESKGAPNGIGLVKLMGRDSGYIAAGAAAASQEVNFVLIPEIPLRLDGPKGFLAVLHKRMTERRHAVIVVAEGAGQDLLPSTGLRDASGNLLKADIGPYLRDRITDHFRQHNTQVNIKYIDPSYIIRSVSANSQDARVCDAFARHAVHAAMAGKTGLIIGLHHSTFIHVPIPLATATRKKVNPEGDLWNAVMSATGQPSHWE